MQPLIPGKDTCTQCKDIHNLGQDTVLYYDNDIISLYTAQPFLVLSTHENLNLKCF